MSDPATERKTLALFQQMLDIVEQDRDAWVEAHTEGQPALRGRLIAMRDAERMTALRTGGVGDAMEEETAPVRVGAYRIVERIGRGGMGAVYRGERETGDFTRDVAIKIIKAGLLSDLLIERFQRERQTLASLIHPNIAQLYDGGETEEGSPYIVMELVDGLPLLQWADEHGLSLDERLRKFREICDAVAFAHARLIVHRDLTPSNVLVTRDGAVKLIDFGIAKPVDLIDDNDDTAGTSIGSLSLTPGYAAPERRISSQVSTSADIYSLGKILENLVEPGSGDAELRTIIAKATEERPADRYQTVDALSDDVMNWHKGLPVDAVQGGRRYMARKFAQRHRAEVIAASVALALLFGALVLTTLAYNRAETARDAEEARFEELRSLAHYMLFDHNDRLERIVGSVEARVELADRAQTYLSELAASSRASDSLRLEAAQGFIKLARIRGVPVEPNFGQRDEAQANLDQAIRLLESVTDPAVGIAPDLATALALRSMIEIHGERDFAGGGQSLARAVSALSAIPRQGRGEPWLIARSEVRKAQLEYATLEGRIEDIIPLADLLESETDRWPQPLRTSRAAMINRAYAAYWLAFSLSYDGEKAPTIAAFRDAEQQFIALDRSQANQPLVLYMLTWTDYMGSAAASEVGDEVESRRLLGQAQQMITRLLALESKDAALHSVKINISEQESQTLAREGEFARALALQREAVTFRRGQMPRHRPPSNVSRLGFSLSVYAEIAQRSGDRALACASHRESMALFEEAEKKDGLGDYRRYLDFVRENSLRCVRGVPVKDFLNFDDQGY